MSKISRCPLGRATSSPTAREASGFFGAMMAMLFIPCYAASLIVSHPNALVVQQFTFFPFTSPVTGMIRNACGSLGLVEALALSSELLVSSYVVRRMVVLLFRTGSIEYSRKVPIRTAPGFARTVLRQRGPRVRVHSLRVPRRT